MIFFPLQATILEVLVIIFLNIVIFTIHSIMILDSNQGTFFTFKKKLCQGSLSASRSVCGDSIIEQSSDIWKIFFRNISRPLLYNDRFAPHRLSFILGSHNVNLKHKMDNLE